VTASFRAKAPGPLMQLGPASSTFAYDQYFDEKPTVGYETLLYQCMLGNAALFQRDDMIDASWAAVQPVLDDWATSKDAPQPYAPNSAGPASADDLPARDGRRWLALEPSQTTAPQGGKPT
jgi:glucose-6-phosphate 1-dehydrogenase